MKIKDLFKKIPTRLAQSIRADWHRACRQAGRKPDPRLESGEILHSPETPSKTFEKITYDSELRETGGSLRSLVLFPLLTKEGVRGRSLQDDLNPENCLARNSLHKALSAFVASFRNSRLLEINTLNPSRGCFIQTSPQPSPL